MRSSSSCRERRDVIGDEHFPRVDGASNFQDPPRRREKRSRPPTPCGAATRRRRDLDFRAIGLLRRLFLSKGRFPADVREELDRERLVLIAEGIPGRLTRAGSRKAGTVVSLAITQQRLVIFTLGESLVDVTWDSGDASHLDLTTEGNSLTVGFDAERFDEDRSGRVELFLHIADPAGLVAAIEQRRRPLEPRRHQGASPDEH